MTSLIATVENGEVTQVMLATPEWAEENLDGEWYDVTGTLVSAHWLHIDGEFRPEPPYPSWVWNGEDYEAPKPMPEPEEGVVWVWDETTVNWIHRPPLVLP